MSEWLGLLGELRKGKGAEEAQRQLGELLEAVAATKKAGVLTFTLTVAPMGEDEDGEVTRFAFKDKMTIKPPVAETATTVLYRDDSGRFTRRDPRQPELPSIVAGKREASGG